MLKNIFKFIFLTVIFATFWGCSQKSSDAKTIKVGTIAGPETDLVETAKEYAKQKYGLDIQIVAFSDYTIPNAALADGSIDANMFQHTPYLDAAIKAKGYKIVPVGKTFVYPMGVYSKKITAIDQVKNGNTVAIPNDPSNEARALLLLEKAKLITLKPNAGTNATILDIADNPLNLKFKEIDAAQLPRTLADVDIAAINTNFAMVAGLLPSRDALIIEDPNSPYANLIVTRIGMENDPRVQELVEALHSQPVLNKAKELFKDQAVPAWK